MTDRFSRLRHYGVVCSNYDHSNVRHLGASCAHRSKCFVTGRIEERDLLIIWQRYLISTDVLRNAPSFTRYDISTAYIIKQRSFSVINVTHDGHYGRARLKFLVHIFIFIYLLHFHLFLHINELDVITKLACHQLNDFRIESLVDRNHYPEAHTLADHFCKTYVHQVCQLTYTYELRNL